MTLKYKVGDKLMANVDYPNTVRKNGVVRVLYYQEVSHAPYVVMMEVDTKTKNGLRFGVSEKELRPLTPLEELL